MGSEPPFSLDACPRCHRIPVEPCYTPAPVCRECEVVWGSPFLAALLRQRLRREPDAEVVAITYVSQGSRPRAESARGACISCCTYNVLLQRGSPFWQFIHAGKTRGRVACVREAGPCRASQACQCASCVRCTYVRTRIAGTYQLCQLCQACRGATCESWAS